MSKTVEKIVINTEGIDVISNINGVNNVTQLNLWPQGDEAKDIFERYNLNSLTNYPFDTRIVRALAESDEQLKDYLETCRRANYSKGKIEIPDTIPEIEYDLRTLKSGFKEIQDVDLRKTKQLEMYQEARKTQNTFKNAKGKVALKMGVLDKGYFAVQELLSSRNKTQTPALMAGRTETRRNLREELRDASLTEKTNQVSKKYVTHEQANEQANEQEIEEK